MSYSLDDLLQEVDKLNVEESWPEGMLPAVRGYIANLYGANQDRFPFDGPDSLECGKEWVEFYFDNFDSGERLATIGLAWDSQAGGITAHLSMTTKTSYFGIKETIDAARERFVLPERKDYHAAAEEGDHPDKP